MSSRVSFLPPLKGEQAAASDPAELVWLSASAGTGKTHVLTARVLRLLLSGVPADAILCLTFTKAGAAEMADRIHARLANWVRLDASHLRKELFALQERHDDAAVDRARTLFASVLDAPGGGLRIQTIHAFCQTLLGSFPAEAGLTPGFRPLDGRGEAALARGALAALLGDAERGGDLGLIRDIQMLSRRLGEDQAEAYLMRCARAGEALAALGPREGIEARIRRALGVPSGDVEALIADACTDAAFDMASFHAVHSANAGWSAGKGQARAAVMASWLQMEPLHRAGNLVELHEVWATKDGGPRSFGKGQAPPNPDYADHAIRLHGRCAELLGLRVKAELTRSIAAGLRAGQSYALAYGAAKRAQGVVDFDDLIQLTVDLLNTPGIGEWIRYKLDQTVDHILVDEAQDTNARQWMIVASLAAEFFSGEGARGKRHRTIFTVGDFKQAIFGFQGTDPRAFEAARSVFESRAADVGRDFLRLSLDRSFRSAAAILSLVDRVIGDLGADALGLSEAAEAHVSARAALPGHVTLWPPISADQAGEDEEGEEGWVDNATRRFAGRLARQIRTWMDERLWIAGKGRPIRPEDILVLVRKRGALASLIVARLHEEDVPVAGVDRLRLNAPLAVRDLLATIRFALQPQDDLTLASLLVSPLFGWSQERLYEVAFKRPGSLYEAVRDQPDCAAGLSFILNQADFTTPHRFLENILSGPIGGRARLIGRLGEEARDPVEELLNAALLFETDTTPGLQRFLDWFDRGEVDITRDPSAPADAVRVMTVHGAKGLQAPVVILADATSDPGASPPGSVTWQVEEDLAAVPIFRPRKGERERADALAEAMTSAQRSEREEHWRLLYVALTRAEERLYIGGSLGPKAKGVPYPDSWYVSVQQAMTGLGALPVEDAHWGSAHHYAEGGQAPRKPRMPRTPLPAFTEPGWLRAPAPQEARPPRPLAPSAIGEDLVADPPPAPAMRDAAKRGRMIHALFERLPPIPPERRTDAADHWLREAAGLDDAMARAEIVASVCAVLADDRYATLFGPDALSEAPIAAVIDTGHVIAGTVDRLLVSKDIVQVIDFKTGRRVPSEIGKVPVHHLKQMAAYVAALEIIFPGRVVQAGLLYTAGPELFDLPRSLLDRYKPDFSG